MKLKMWLWVSLKNLIWVLAISVFYSILLGTEGHPILSRLELMPYYLTIGGWMILCILSGVSLFYYIPLSISLGSTRKACFIGLQMIKIIPCIIITALCFVIACFIKSDVTAGVMKLMPVIFMVLLSGGSIGAIISCVKLRFGKAGAIIMVALFALIGGVNGFFLASSGKFNFMQLNLEGSGALTLIVGLVTLALFAGSVITQYFSLKKYEVKLI